MAAQPHNSWHARAAFDVVLSQIKLILMGEVHSMHWKTHEGSVIGLLNPRALDSSDNAHAKVRLLRTTARTCNSSFTS